VYRTPAGLCGMRFTKQKAEWMMQKGNILSCSLMAYEPRARRLDVLGPN